MFGWFWKRHAATNKKDLLRRIADGKITKSPPRKRWGHPRYQEGMFTLPVLGSLLKRDLTNDEILMLGNIRRSAIDSDFATDENLSRFNAISRMDMKAGNVARKRPIITRSTYYSAGIPAADQGTYMSRVTYVADDILGRYCDSRNKIDIRTGGFLGEGPLFQNYLKDGFATYLRGPKEPLYVMVLTDGHIGCMILTVVPSPATLYLCVEAFNLAPTDITKVIRGLRRRFHSEQRSLYQIVLQVPVREAAYNEARLFTRALRGPVTESVLSSFHNGKIANEGKTLIVQESVLDIHCQTWIVVYPILRLVMGKSVLVTSRWFESVVELHGHRFIDEARAIFVELAAVPPRALELVKKLITTVAEEDVKFSDFSQSLFRVEKVGAPLNRPGIVPEWENRSWLQMEGQHAVNRRHPMTYNHASFPRAFIHFPRVLSLLVTVPVHSVIG
ncbi:hypothetical protein KFL_001880180 [Klebsormidium nitens]|uniref:Uncharacterized protein n=1 Tax=Klebsormidium nitens TaxID=105231 RepID=A0A1Y1I0I5_KLENI|nr:hypothetical protein KFL_001880180 [Klebsormidium nitens]|eukprot:GAQ84424.1 hypothetical protein KFL_001880180 [Klebsormidium nitens]